VPSRYTSQFSSAITNPITVTLDQPTHHRNHVFQRTRHVWSNEHGARCFCKFSPLPLGQKRRRYGRLSANRWTEHAERLQDLPESLCAAVRIVPITQGHLQEHKEAEAEVHGEEREGNGVGDYVDADKRRQYWHIIDRSSREKTQRAADTVICPCETGTDIALRRYKIQRHFHGITPQKLYT
jgi:hypothetical protein